MKWTKILLHCKNYCWSIPFHSFMAWILGGHRIRLGIRGSGVQNPAPPSNLRPWLRKQQSPRLCVRTIKNIWKAYFNRSLERYHVNSSNDLLYNGRFAYHGSPHVVLPTMSVCLIVDSPTAILPTVSVCLIVNLPIVFNQKGIYCQPNLTWPNQLPQSMFHEAKWQ